MASSENGASGQDVIGRPQPLNAPLFRSLMERMHEGGRSVVLDLGPAQPRTIALLSHFRCRLDIADIEEGFAGLKDDTEPDTLGEKIEALLPAKREEPTDLVLCWDLLNYLTRPALTALMDCIADRGHSGMLAHALVAYSNTRMPAAPNRYAPTDDYSLSVTPVTDEQREAPRYNLEDLRQCLPRYRRERAMLLRNGMQEFLFRL